MSLRSISRPMSDFHNDDVALRISNVTKHFVLPHQKASTIKSFIINPFVRYENEKQLALKDISFEVKKGEFFGIIGRNGSGKSTLLKCISGVYKPDSGHIGIHGSLVPFIELGVGFNPNLSGRDNVFLNGALLGFSRPEMEAMYDEIVEFAELEKFMDQKLKNYSSGMQVRLAFSISIRAHSDILLLDEVLAVGDSAFKQKCNNYFFSLKEQKKTIILVSHSMSSIEEYCDRAMILENGKILDIGEPSRITDIYNEINFRSSEPELEKRNQQSKEVLEAVDEDASGKPKKAQIVSVETFEPKSNKAQNTFKYTEKIGIRYEIKAHEDIKSPTVGLVLRDKKRNRIFATNTLVKNTKVKNLKKGQTVKVEFVLDNIFDNTTYVISGAIASHDRSETLHRVADIHAIDIFGWKMMNSMVNPSHDITIKY